MILLGYISNRIGRRNGSIITSFLMCLGSFFLVVLSLLFTSSSSSDDDENDNDNDDAASSSGDEDVVLLFHSIVLSLFIFGIGVGGEYPLSASLASEKATATATATQEEIQQNHRRDDQTPMTNTIIDHNNNQTIDSKKIPLVNNNDDNDYVIDTVKETIVAVDQKNQKKNQKRYFDGRGRGRSVQLIFANQGLGIWCNTLTMLLLLSILQIRNNNDANNDANNNANDNEDDGNDDNDDDNNTDTTTYTYTEGQLLLVWRITYIIGSLVLFFVFISRIFYLKESKVWLNNNDNNDSKSNNKFCRNKSISSSNNSKATTKTKTTSTSTPRTTKEYNDNDDGTDGIVRETTTNTTALFHQHYGMRLFGASMSWLLWDISFYGNKLFQSIFIVALFDGGSSSSDSSNNDTAAASLLQLTSVSFLNATVALIGYYCAAYIIELPWLGRYVYVYVMLRSTFICLQYFIRATGFFVRAIV